MKKSIKENYFYNLLFQILTLIIPLITAPYLSRILGVNGIGISSYTLSLVSYFILFGGIGISSYGQREIAMNRNDKNTYSKIFWELFILRIISNIISILCFIIFIIVTSEYNLILGILIINILASMFDISWFYQGLEEYKFISIRNIVIKLIFTILIFIFVKEKDDLIIYILLNSMSLIISSLSLWIRLRKLITKIKIKELRVSSHFKQTLIYFLPQIAIQIYTMVDKTMLGVITGSQIENGYYEQAHKIVNMTLTVIISLNTVMSPRMSYLYKENKLSEIKKRLQKSLKYTMFLGFPMTIGLAAISNGFVEWFFGAEYEKVILLLIVFSPIILIISLSNCLGGQCLTPCGMRLKSAGALFCGAIANFVINLILIPCLGSVGAAIASVIAELIITILYFKMSKKYINIKEIFKGGLKYFILSLIMGICIYILSTILNNGIISTFIEINVGIIIYLLLLYLVKDDLILELYSIIVNKVRRLK